MESIFLIGAGLLDLYFSWKFLTDLDFAHNYVKNSPKALIWRKLFGVEKAQKVLQKVFAPVGIALGILLVILGLFILI